MKNLIKYGFIALVICFSSCSELAHNSNEFVVYKMTKLNSEVYEYQIKPTKGLGNLFVNTSELYNIGDTLALSLHCR